MRKKKPSAIASIVKPTALADEKIASDTAVMPRPITKLVSLPDCASTMLTKDRPAIHQNQRAPDRAAGVVDTTVTRVGAAAASGV